MARAKTKVKKPLRPRTKRTKRMQIARPLDSYGMAYAKLLADPCAAPLCHPIYAGSEAGFIVRCDSFATYGGDTSTAGILHWTPGYPTAGNTDLLVQATVGSNISPAGGIVSNGLGPGKLFLTDVSAVRCVAACVKVSYPGAESGRSGRIHYGHTPAGLIDSGDTVTTDAVAPNLQHFSRTPPEPIEIVWKPGQADQEFNDPLAAASATLRDRKSAITVAWAGIPPSTGMTFHFTAVYEWVPKTGLGVSNNSTGKNPSINSLDHVIDYLQASGFRWVRSMAAHATTGALTALSGAFGLIPSVQNRFSNQRFLGY